LNLSNNFQLEIRNFSLWLFSEIQQWSVIRTEFIYETLSIWESFEQNSTHAIFWQK
jgi:hypothetical protein